MTRACRRSPITVRFVVWFGALVVFVCSSVLSTCAVRAAADAGGNVLSPGREYHNDFPDPSVLAVDGTYYAYGTTSGGVHIPMLRSLDLRSWYVMGDALPTLPSWAADHDIWAPSVVPIAGHYALYYAAPVADTGQQCISVATASSPIGPFVDSSTQPLVCSTDFTANIDPDVFLDPNGSVWILWKTEPRSSSDHPRIWVQQMSGDGTVLQGSPMELLSPSQSWEGSNIEAPEMWSINGLYVLMYSASAYYSSKYATGYALCLTVAGPCLKAKLPLLQSADWMRGPGGASFFNDAAGHLQVAYHYWTAPNVGYPAGRRRMRITEVVASPFGLATGATVSDLPSFKASTTLAASPSGNGYAIAWTNGAVDTGGDAGFFGSVGGTRLTSPVVGVSTTPTGNGYWLVASDGGVFAFGDAQFLGSEGGAKLNRPIVGVASTRSGKGYWLVASDGGLFAFGDAAYFGSPAGTKLNQPIVAMTVTPTGHGYWLVASDGGVFTFGDARFFGSTGAIKLNQPIAAMAATPSGNGYWFVARDGGVFNYGDATFAGSMGGAPLNAPIVSIAALPAPPTPSPNSGAGAGAGYWLLGSDGGVFAFGAAGFYPLVR